MESSRGPWTGTYIVVCDGFQSHLIDSLLYFCLLTVVSAIIVDIIIK